MFTVCHKVPYHINTVYCHVANTEDDSSDNFMRNKGITRPPPIGRAGKTLHH